MHRFNDNNQNLNKNNNKTNNQPTFISATAIQFRKRIKPTLQIKFS